MAGMGQGGGGCGAWQVLGATGGDPEAKVQVTPSVGLTLIVSREEVQLSMAMRFRAAGRAAMGEPGVRAPSR